MPIAKITVAAGKRYCPHFLGGGVGLIASAHILAAVGGNGWLEVDSNPNPLRESLYDPNVTNGSINLADNEGLGITIDALDALCNNTHRAN